MGLKNRITREYIIDTIGEKNIFEYYIGRPIEIGRAYNSFLTKDSTPSTGFYVNEHGTLLYNDLRTNKKYDCILFVKEIINKNYHETLTQVAVDFGLISGEKTKDKIGIIKPFINKVKKKEKAKISVKIKPYSKEDLEFWAQYNITKEELIKYNIVSVLWYQIGSYTIYIEDELCFAYLIYDKDEMYIKIYRPHNDKFKWQTNVPLNCPQGLDNIDCNGKSLIITKSLKDYIVLKKIFNNTIYVQNESKVCISEDLIKVLKKCYKYIYIWFDMDKPGIMAAQYYKKQYGLIPIFISSKKFNIWQNLQIFKKTKDPSDFVKEHGFSKFEKMIKNEKIYN